MGDQRDAGDEPKVAAMIDRASMTDLAAMTAAVGHPGRVVIANSALGGPVATLSGPAGEAVVALQGAQLLSWTPAGHDPVIWLSPVERLGTTKAVRGGTPVCWPWFAAHPSDPGKPAHGFVRTRLWSIAQSGITDTGAWITLVTQTLAADAALWPHAATVQLRVALGQHLELSIRTTNTGDTPFTLTQALHTYFSIGDIADIDISGFDDEIYRDKLDDGRPYRQTGVITFPGEVDRIYDAHAPVTVTYAATIHDRRLNRQIRVTQSGSRSAVVWNPGPVKAARLADMGHDGWRRFVCVETTNAGDDARVLGVCETHVMGAIYTVTRV